jgi:hypothetical protein
MMITTRHGAPLPSKVEFINFGKWFGKTWFIDTTHGHFIVEADTFADAIDELIDSDYGSLFHTEPCPACRPIRRTHIKNRRAPAFKYAGCTPELFTDIDNSVNDCSCDFAGNDGIPVDATGVRGWMCVVYIESKAEADALQWYDEPASSKDAVDAMRGTRVIYTY